MPRKYSKSARDLFAEIIEANAHKIIVIDFWATWCAPCIEDFKGMQPLKEKISPDSISFIYLCSQSSREVWLKQVKKYGVKGQHHFLSEIQYSEFKKCSN